MTTKIWHAAKTGSSQGLVIAENGDNIAVTYDADDAAIIAAAPELLDALQNLYNACEFWEDRADPVLKNARAAIQKAESE